MYRTKHKCAFKYISMTRFKDDCDAKMRRVIFLSRNSKAATERPSDDDLKLIQKSIDGNGANKTFEYMPISFAMRIPRQSIASTRINRQLCCLASTASRYPNRMLTALR